MIYRKQMLPQTPSRAPHWYGIPVRVLLMTFIGTLLCFAVSLLLAIFGTLITSIVRGVHPDMSLAYRHIALPAALIVGSIVFLPASAMEVPHYRQTKALTPTQKITSTS